MPIKRKAHIGRRGAILMTLGIGWIVMGSAIWASPVDPTPDILYEYVPHWIRVTLWLGTGLIAIISAFTPLGKDDAFGFGALYLMPAERAFSFLWLLIASGTLSAIFGLLIYAVFMALITITAGWQEPPSTLKLDDDAGGE